MLQNLVESTKKEHLTKISAVAIIVWIFAPILITLCNLFNLDGFVTYKIWQTVMYLVGGCGLLVGCTYLYQILDNSKQPMNKKLFALLPFLALLAFGVWCFIAALAAKRTLVAIFGYSFICDCFITYVNYAGFILLGLVLSRDKKKAKLLANIFIIVSVVLALITLMDNGVSVRLCENRYTNCFHYESVFYNTNHYAYYLLINILLSGYMFIFAKDIKLKLAYIASNIIFIITLILNDTMGAYLAVLIVLIFAFIWSFINKEDKKKELIILLVVFILVSGIMCIFTDSIINNFVNMFADANTMLDNIDADDVEADSVGSGRGALWRLYWDVMKKYPILGVGSENIGASAHNMFLQIGAYNGFVGLALYLSVFVIGAIRLIQKRKELTNAQKTTAFIVVGYLISGFFGVTMFYTAPYFYIAVGICFSAALKDLTYEEVL